MTRSRRDGYTSSISRYSDSSKGLISSDSDSSASKIVKSLDLPYQTLECLDKQHGKEHGKEHEKEHRTDQSESESSQQSELQQQINPTAHVTEKGDTIAGTAGAIIETTDFNAAHIKVLNRSSIATDLSSENDDNRDTVPAAEHSSELVDAECSSETMEALQLKCAMFARKIAQLECDLQASRGQDRREDKGEHKGENRGEHVVNGSGEDRIEDREMVNKGEFNGGNCKEVEQGDDKKVKYVKSPARYLKRSLMDDLIIEHVDDIEKSIGGFDSIYPSDPLITPTDNPILNNPILNDNSTGHNSRRVLIEWDPEHLWRDSITAQPFHSSPNSPHLAQDKSTSPIKYFKKDFMKNNIKNSSSPEHNNVSPKNKNISPSTPMSPISAKNNHSSESNIISHKCLKIFSVESPMNSRQNSNTNSPVNSVNKGQGRGFGGRGGLFPGGLSPPPPRVKNIAIGTIGTTKKNTNLSTGHYRNPIDNPIDNTMNDSMSNTSSDVSSNAIINAIYDRMSNPISNHISNAFNNRFSNYQYDPIDNPSGNHMGNPISNYQYDPINDALGGSSSDFSSNNTRNDWSNNSNSSNNSSNSIRNNDYLSSPSRSGLTNYMRNESSSMRDNLRNDLSDGLRIDYSDARNDLRIDSNNGVRNDSSSATGNSLRNDSKAFSKNIPKDFPKGSSKNDKNGTSGPKDFSKGSLKDYCFCSNIRIDSVDNTPREALCLQAQDGSMINLMLGGDVERNINRNRKQNSNHNVKRNLEEDVKEGSGCSTEEKEVKVGGELGEKGEGDNGEGIKGEEGGVEKDETGDTNNTLCSFCRDYGDLLLNHFNLYDDDRGLLVHKLLSGLSTALNLKTDLSSDLAETNIDLMANNATLTENNTALTENNTVLTADNTALSDKNTELELKVTQLEGFITVTRQSSSFSSPTGSKEMKENMLLTGELFQECSRLRGQVLDLERKMKITEEEKNSIINNVPSAIKTMHSEGVHKPLRSSDSFLFRDKDGKDGRDRDTLLPDSEASTPTTRTPSIRWTLDPSDRTRIGAPEGPQNWGQYGGPYGTPYGVSSGVIYGASDGAPEGTQFGGLDNAQDGIQDGAEGGKQYIFDTSIGDGCATQTQTSPGLHLDIIGKDLKRQALNEIQMIKSDLESKLFECIYKRKGGDDTVSGTFTTLELVDEIPVVKEKVIRLGGNSRNVSPKKERKGEKLESKGERKEVKKEDRGESNVEIKVENKDDDMQLKLRYLMNKVYELHYIAIERDAEFEVLARGFENQIQGLSSALFLALGANEEARQNEGNQNESHQNEIQQQQQCISGGVSNDNGVHADISGPLAISAPHTDIAPSSSTPSFSSSPPSNTSTTINAINAINASQDSDHTTCPFPTHSPTCSSSSSPSHSPHSSSSGSPSSWNALSFSSSSPPITTPFFAPFPNSNPYPNPNSNPVDTEYSVHETKLVPKLKEKEKRGKKAKEGEKRIDKIAVVNE